MIKEKNIKRGFSLVEIMLAIALSAILIPAFVSALHFSIFSTSQGENFSKAYGLAQEQMEAVYFLKNTGDASWDWDNTPSETTVGEYYQVIRSGNTWALGSKTTTPQPVDGFTSKMEIKPVRRDADGSINDASGSVDSTSRYVTVYVDWLENGQLQTVSLDSLVSKY